LVELLATEPFSESLVLKVLLEAVLEAVTTTAVVEAALATASLVRTGAD